MKVYQVGGSVRDFLIGRPSNDTDLVVVGATNDQMIELGYSQVGKDFPVFLHPETGEEYALARVERKNGVGHHGFDVVTENVSLVEDLKRRDFTMNAMAFDHDGSIIDPFGGAEDIKSGVIRHVSEAFSEDPLRVLRAGRFAARYGFEVHPDTIEEIRKVVESGELKNISKERIWTETQKALREENPLPFFDLLVETGAWWDCFPLEPKIPKALFYTSYYYKLLMVFGDCDITKQVATSMRMRSNEYDIIAFIKAVGVDFPYTCKTPEQRVDFINRLKRLFDPNLVFEEYITYFGTYYSDPIRLALLRDRSKLESINWEFEIKNANIPTSSIKEFVKQKSIEVLT